MSDRRDVLKALAATFVAGELTPGLEAQHVHHMAAAQKASGAPYKPKAFTAEEFKTIELLCEQIIPGASKGNAAEFIDLLASAGPELQARWTGGLAWMDRWTQRESGQSYASAPAMTQTKLLDLIAYRKNASPALNPGIRFFDLARRMVVDAYYTSAAGTAEVGYQGNKGMTVFQVPAEAIRYALDRSPFKGEA
jgi:hypothetical protein